MNIKLENLQAQGKYLLIEPYKAAEKSESGLIMDNSSNTSAAPVRGTVITAGSETKYKAGDDLFFRRYSTDELKFITEKGEQMLTIVEEQDVLLLNKVD